MTSITWTGGRAGAGAWTLATNWIGGVPRSGDTDTDKNGVITATSTRIADQTVVLDSADAEPWLPIGLNMINSNFGPGSYLQIKATPTDPINVELHNTLMRGDVLTWAGASCFIIDAGTSTTNYGWIGVASGAGGASDVVVDYGTFTNVGTIQSGANGNFDLVFGNNPAQQQYVVNNGIIEADKNGTLAFNAGQSGSVSYGTVINRGTISADGGTITLLSDLTQSATGVVSITKGGVLNMSGEADGGTIQIQSGMLNFGEQATFLAGPASAAEFTSKLDFTGSSGAVAFGNPQIKEAFSAATHSISIKAALPGTQNFTQIADLHLGTARVYSASEFSIGGSMLLFHATTS